MTHEGEGMVVRIVCAEARINPRVLDGIFKETKLAPSIGFNGTPMEKVGEYAYYMFPHGMDFYEIAEKISKIEGVIRAEVVEQEEMRGY